MLTPGSVLISSKEDGLGQKNFQLKLALNMTKPVMEQKKKTAFHLNCFQYLVQTMDRQDTEELISLLY